MAYISKNMLVLNNLRLCNSNVKRWTRNVIREQTSKFSSASCIQLAVNKKWIENTPVLTLNHDACLSINTKFAKRCLSSGKYKKLRWAFTSSASLNRFNF